MENAYKLSQVLDRMQLWEYLNILAHLKFISILQAKVCETG